MARRHRYTATVTWTGNRGAGTSGYATYSRDHAIRIPGKPEIAGSSDPAFRGDPARVNPEDMLVASLSACHMLWYLHLASEAGITVVAYEDEAEGAMEESREGGRFVSVVLRPRIRIGADDDRARAAALHQRAHALCFIANSVNFPVSCEPLFD
jgi:organic hydroperoxide reductase OsmC/OhrA